MMLSTELRASMQREARARLPREACGLLIGRRVGECVEVLEVRHARNVARDPARFEVDPADHLANQRHARARGLDVVGVWHSHPEGPATPSGTDLREAVRGWAYVILDARDGACRAWRSGADGFEELELVEAGR